MSKGIKAFERLMKESPEVHIESYELVKMELKAFDLIDRKSINVNRLKQIIQRGLPWHTYNHIQDEGRHITEEEFDLLKEAFK